MANKERGAHREDIRSYLLLNSNLEQLRLLAPNTVDKPTGLSA